MTFAIDPMWDNWRAGCACGVFLAYAVPFGLWCLWRILTGLFGGGP